jgi:hypothetical protein
MIRERMLLYDLADRHLRTVQTAVDRLHMLNGSDAELRRLSHRLHRMALRAAPVEPVGSLTNPARAG